MCKQGYHHISPYLRISAYLTRSLSDLEWFKDGLELILILDGIWADFGMWGTSRIDRSVVKSCWQLVRSSRSKPVSPWLGRTRRNHTGSLFPQVSIFSSIFYKIQLCFNHIVIRLVRFCQCFSPRSLTLVINLSLFDAAADASVPRCRGRFSLRWKLFASHLGRYDFPIPCSCLALHISWYIMILNVLCVSISIYIVWYYTILYNYIPRLFQWRTVILVIYHP